MVHLKLYNVSAHFPIFNSKQRSLKRSAFQLMTGAKLKKAVDGVTIVEALTDISFTINEGERVAILGHNGSGKSTMLRVLSEVYVPSAGAISINGRIGSLIDISLGIDPEATGRENIFTRGALLGLSQSEVKNLIDDIVDFSELGDFIDLPVRIYSSGMQMRLAFATIMLMNSDIIIMDEWLSVGDADFNKKADTKLREIVDKSSVLIMATHQRESAINNCDRGIVLEKGRLILDAPIEDACAFYFG